MRNRSGFFKTNLTGELSYKSFFPESLYKININKYDLINELLIEAHKNLGILNTYANKIADIDIFLSSYVKKEALLSSQIEGIEATLIDIFDSNISTNVNLDVLEVLNYVKTINYAKNRIEEFPICNRLFKELHFMLLNDGRGEEKNPGEFRTSQNWIGGIGSNLKTATYVPPNPTDMEILMSDLEKYINDEIHIDPLIKTALIHYQFETIHPFLDGNGRVGRILILLYLINSNILSKPVLYISYGLKIRRREYYDRLKDIRLYGNYEKWIIFFLEQIIFTSKEAIEKLDKLIELRKVNKNKIYIEKKAGKLLLLFEYIEKFPIINIKKTSNDLNLSFNTVSTLVNKLIEIGILKELFKKSRNRVYIYDDYINILNDNMDDL